jgi:hypothetical protein
LTIGHLCTFERIQTLLSFGTRVLIRILKDRLYTGASSTLRRVGNRLQEICSWPGGVIENKEQRKNGFPLYFLEKLRYTFMYPMIVGSFPLDTRQ